MFSRDDAMNGEAYLVHEGKVEVRKLVDGEERVLKTLGQSDLLGGGRPVPSGPALGHRGGRRARHAPGDSRRSTRGDDPGESEAGDGPHPPACPHGGGRRRLRRVSNLPTDIS